jgi:hypothetical protein
VPPRTGHRFFDAENLARLAHLPSPVRGEISSGPLKSAFTRGKARARRERRRLTNDPEELTQNKP